MGTGILRFENFEVDQGAYELRHAGQVVHLERLPLDLLFLLLERRGQLVTRQEIVEKIWGKALFIDSDNSINSAIRKLRRALQDNAGEPRFVVAIPGKGYRFIAAVHEEKSVQSRADDEETVQPVQGPFVGRERTLAESRGSLKAVLSLTGLALIVGTVVLVQNLSLKPLHTHASIPPQEKPALPIPSIPSIAVLPFTNLSGDPQQEYFSDGMTGQIISDLSRLSGLFVIARNSSFTYKGKTVREREIGTELGVKYVLEGSVQKAADRIRIGVELVDASTGTEMWTQHFDQPLTDIFAVQDEIVGKVVTTLGLILKLEDMKVPRGGTDRTQNLEAFDDLLRANEYFWRFTKDDMARSRQWAKKAIALDPKFADAYALQAASYRTDVLFRLSENPGADLKHSWELAQEALALDDSNSSALATLCGVDWMQRKFDSAVTEGERAVAINPNDAFDYQLLTEALLVSGRFEDAIRAAQKAARLDPSGQDFWAYFIGQGYVGMERYPEAIPLLKRSIAAYPNMPWPHVALIVAYTELGRGQDARAEAAEFKRISPGFVLGDISKDAAVDRRYDADLRKAGLK